MLPTLSKVPTPYVDSSFSTDDKNELHEAVITADSSNVTSAIACIDVLMHSLKENVLFELDKECTNISSRGEPSELRNNEFRAMTEFDWTKLASEMSTRCPFLLDVLLTVMDKSKDEINDITPRLGLCYAILMHTRNRELSLVQRLNTVLFTNGNAKKEVG